MDPAGGDYSFYKEAAEHFVTFGTFDSAVNIAPGWSSMLVLNVLSPFSEIATLRGIAIMLFIGLVLGVYGTLRQVLSDKQAYVTAVLTSVYPPLFFETLNISSGQLFFTVMLFGAFSTLFIGYLQQSKRHIMVSGVLLGIAILTDPAIVYLPIIIGVWIFYAHIRTVKQGIVLSILFSLGVCIIVFPWLYRNTVVIGPGSAIVSKQIELEVLDEDTLRRIGNAWIMRSDSIGEQALRFFAVPKNLAMLTPQATTPTQFSDLLRAQNVIKLSIMLLHGIVIALFMLAICLPQRASKQFRFVSLVGMVVDFIFFASITYGAIRVPPFANMSPINSFLFPLVPLLFISIGISSKILLEQCQKYFHRMC